MIYSKDIERVCGLCVYASIEENGDECECMRTKKRLPKSTEACKRFSYDIQKRVVRRPKKLNTEFSAEDFTI